MINENKTKTPSLVSWETKVRNYLKFRKKLHALSFEEISRRLKELNIHQSKENLSNKFQTGKLSSALLISILTVMGDNSLELNEFHNIK
jgi:uncharacterized protein DUF6471